MLVTVLLPASASAMQLSDNAPAIGQMVVVKAEVPSAFNGGTLYDPAVYVDWTGGACPAGAADARTKAKGDFRRGMGFAVEPNNFSTHGGPIPVTGQVLIEQARQTVCIYGRDGSVADQMVITGTPSFPPRTSNGSASRWLLFSPQYNVQSAHSQIQIQFAGMKPMRANFGCDTKRFSMTPSKIRFDSAGHLSYNGSAPADNSNNYDAPVPLKYHGRATLKVSGTIGVGAQPLSLPLTSSHNVNGPVIPKGKWGYPVVKVKGSFSAPGYRARPNTKPCSASFQFVMSPSLLGDSDNGSAMAGQGSARMATDPKHPKQQPADEAGKGEQVPVYTPPPDVPPEPAL